MRLDNKPWRRSFEDKIVFNYKITLSCRFGASRASGDVVGFCGWSFWEKVSREDISDCKPPIFTTLTPNHKGHSELRQEGFPPESTLRRWNLGIKLKGWPEPRDIITQRQQKRISDWSQRNRSCTFDRKTHFEWCFPSMSTCGPAFTLHSWFLPLELNFPNIFLSFSTCCCRYRSFPSIGSVNS